MANKGGLKTRKIPERRCTGCGESFPKKELVRIVRTPEGEVTLDFTGKVSGRGAYLCPKLSCFKKAKKQKRISRSLDTEIPEEMYELLEHEITVLEKELSDRD